MDNKTFDELELENQQLKQLLWAAVHQAPQHSVQLPFVLWLDPANHQLEMWKDERNASFHIQALDRSHPAEEEPENPGPSRPPTEGLDPFGDPTPEVPDDELP